MRERKVLPHFRKAIQGRAVTGIFSVFGNIDSYKDVVMPGAFTKTVAERKDEVFHLWQHSFDAPAIAVVKELRELRQDELPDAIKAKHPEATGGQEVTREYLETERGEELLKGHIAGVPYKMSFAFDPVKFDLGEQDGVKVRYLRENRLYETSDVLWGANDATIASKQAPTAKALAAAFGGLKVTDDIRALWAAQDECYDLAGGASAFCSVAYLLAGECDDPAASAPLIAVLRMLLSFLENEISDVEAQIAAGTASDGMQLMALPGLLRQVKTLQECSLLTSADADLLEQIGAAVSSLIPSIDPPAPAESRAEPVSLTLEKARLFILDYHTGAYV
jgi:HK97 family phage prohead protease